MHILQLLLTCIAYILRNHCTHPRSLSLPFLFLALFIHLLTYQTGHNGLTGQVTTYGYLGGHMSKLFPLSQGTLVLSPLAVLPASAPSELKAFVYVLDG